jgi:hypothetical protein
MLIMITNEIKNLSIVCGHYGSGKTNFAVNLALEAKKQLVGKIIRIADLDIVNPYFRTADDRDLLENAGVFVSLPEYANSNVDIPVLPPMLIHMFTSKDDISIIDVGGDDGAVALGMYKDRISATDYDMYYVINMYRPLTATPEDVYACMLEIEALSGLKCTKIINNSSLGAETTAEDILDSIAYAEECAKMCGIPLVAHTYCPSYAPDLADKIKGTEYEKKPLFPIRDVTKKLF